MIEFQRVCKFFQGSEGVEEVFGPCSAHFQGAGAAVGPLVPTSHPPTIAIAFRFLIKRSFLDYFFTLCKPARSMARRTSGFFMNHFHTNPVRRFSALSRVIPTSMPITSGETHPLLGLKASVK